MTLRASRKTAATTALLLTTLGATPLWAGDAPAPHTPQRDTAQAAVRAAAQEMRELRQQERQRNNIYQVWFPDLATARKAAISFHHALLESKYDEGYLVLELEPEEYAALQSRGFRLETAHDFIKRRNAFLERFQKASDENLRQGGNGDISIESIPGYACYETVEETFAAAQAFATSKPNLAQWLDVGNSWQKNTGSGGYDIRVLKLTNTAIGGTKPKLFINSAIHAREYTTAPLVLEFARWLVNGYGTNADATWMLDHHEIHLMLHTNPDGRKKAEGGLSWRKNTNTAYCGANSNSRGADLNRNFTFSWNATNGQGSSGNACNETYRGPSAHSEPETQAIEGYIASIFPDSRGPNPGDAAPATTMGVHLDIHSYSQLVLWPWGTTNQPAPNGTALQTMGRRLAWFNGYTPEQSIGLYPTDGTSDGPSYGDRGVAAFTIELGSSFFESCTTYNNTTKPKNLPALIYAARVARAPYQLPAGPDVASLSLNDGTGVPAGTAVTLTASITDTRFNNSNGTEPTQAISAAEAYIDTPPWSPGATPIALSAADGSFNSTTESITGTLNTTNLSNGKHIVFVRGKDASGAFGPVSSVYLTIGQGTPPATETEPNNSIAAANPVAAPVTLTGTMGNNTDSDFFSVSLPAGATLTSTLTPNVSSDYDLYVYDSAGTLLGKSERGSGLVDTVNVTNTGTSAVSRYVKVLYYGGNTGAGGTYSLQLSW
ncbi:M14 family zinc carboxypeptidase [Ideonella sp. DXS29W]|uniref:M14 family zinc carboxypeptidase n=1 Tax=Ideonella lacteola TaxID=2984193 RepID=A0ABU9BQQ6_9BURK